MEELCDSERKRLEENEKDFGNINYEYFVYTVGIILFGNANEHLIDNFEGSSIDPL